MKQLLISSLILFTVTISVQAQTDITVSLVTRPAQPLKKILILSMLKNYDNRKTVENEISWWINDKGYAAFACNKIQKNQDLPSRELIKSMVDENGFDGVLISNLVDVQMKERFEINPDRTGYNPMVPTFYNYLDAYGNAYNLGYNYNTKSFEITTKLFEVSDNVELYECSSSTYQSSDIDKAIENYAKAMAKSLKKNKILQKKSH
jgi:hypothetical protein